MCGYHGDPSELLQQLKKKNLGSLYFHSSYVKTSAILSALVIAEPSPRLGFEEDRWWMLNLLVLSPKLNPNGLFFCPDTLQGF